MVRPARVGAKRSYVASNDDDEFVDDGAYDSSSEGANKNKKKRGVKMTEAEKEQKKAAQKQAKQEAKLRIAEEKRSLKQKEDEIKLKAAIEAQAAKDKADIELFKELEATRNDAARRKTTVDQLNRLRVLTVLTTDAVEVPADCAVDAPNSPFPFDFAECHAELKLATSTLLGRVSATVQNYEIDPNFDGDFIYPFRTILLRSFEDGMPVVVGTPSKQGFTVVDILKAIELCETQSLPSRKISAREDLCQMKGVFYDGACGFYVDWEKIS
jgi:hypothetical protein